MFDLLLTLIIQAQRSIKSGAEKKSWVLAGHAGYTDFIWLAQNIDFVIMLLKDPAVHKVFNTTYCIHPSKLFAQVLDEKELPKDASHLSLRSWFSEGGIE